jgi:hypothetical protein
MKLRIDGLISAVTPVMSVEVAALPNKMNGAPLDDGKKKNIQRCFP